MGAVDDIISKFAEQAAVIKAAPYPFILAIAVAVGVIWYIVNYAYSTVLTSKNAQLELADRQIADYKQKLGGASPDEAKAQIDALDKQVSDLRAKELERTKRIWPSLTKDKIIQWSDKLSKFPVDFLAVFFTDDDSRDFRDSLYETFARAHWPNPNVVNAGSGIGIRIRAMKCVRRGQRERQPYRRSG